MSIIDREEDRTYYEGALKVLANSLLRTEADHLIFLGAGASIDDEQSDLPDGRTLSKDLAREVNIDWHEEIPLSRIAFYFEAIRGRDDLNAFLRKRLGRKTAPDGTQSNQTARTLEYLVEILDIVSKQKKSTVVITTNYDELFEIAYENKHKRRPEVLTYRGGIDSSDTSIPLLHGLQARQTSMSWRPREQVALFKMHGCITDADGHNLVITDENYINFIGNAGNSHDLKRLPWYIQGLLMNSTVLFVGYSLEDWNFRILFKQTGEKSDRKRYAVQYVPSPPVTEQTARAKRKAAVDFWHKKSVDIINLKGDEFMKDLLEAVRKQALQAQTA